LFVSISIFFVLFIGVTYFPNSIIQDLENKYSDRPDNLENYVGIILLSGAIHGGNRPIERNDSILGHEAERMTKSMELLHHYPHLQLVFTGGSSQLRPVGLSESGAAKIFFDAQGVDQGRIIYETKSRNTYENSLFSARLSTVDPNKSWLLLTSAIHMPRALAVFRAAEWNITPYATDFQTGIETMNWTDYSILRGNQLWGQLLHEVIGYWAYTLTGKL